MKESSKELIYKSLLGLYLFSAILGNFNVVNFKIFGVYPTLYRITIPALAAISLIILFLFAKTKPYISFSSKMMLFTVLLFLIYGIIMLFLSDTVDKHEGLKTIMLIVLGLLSLITIFTLLEDENSIRVALTICKFILVILIIMALYEIISGNHLSVSRFCDSSNLKSRNISAKTKMHLATGVFYNENDFCTLISTFSPLFFNVFQENKIKSLLNLVCMFFIIFIFIVNDAWICWIAFLMSLILYLIMRQHKPFYKSIVFLSFIIVIKRFGLYALTCTVDFIAKLMGNGSLLNYGEHFKTGANSFNNTVSAQINSSEIGVGSAFRRMHTYKKSIEHTFLDTYGFGYGPGSFSNFSASLNDKTMLLNPHCMWIEILTEYGAFLFLAFFLCLFSVFVSLIKLYKKTKSDLIPIICAIDISFVIASFAPSSLFAVSYMWIPIGLSFATINAYENINHNTKPGLNLDI